MITKQEQKKQVQNNTIYTLALASRIRKPGTKGRVGLARKRFELLKQVEPVNGQAVKMAKAVNALADALKSEYGTSRGTQAAVLAGELRTFGRNITPFGKANVELATSSCIM